MSEPIEITRGDDETIDLVVYDKDAPIADAGGRAPTDPFWTPTYAPQNLSGGKLWWYVFLTRGQADSAALIRKSSPDNGIEINPDQAEGDDHHRGEATVTLTPADTVDGPVGYFYVELQGLVGGKVKTLETTRIRIRPDLVRASS